MRVEPVRAVRQKTAGRKPQQGKEGGMKRSIKCEHPAGGTPAWDVAMCLPAQGQWTEETYLRLEQLRPEGFPLLELTNGRLSVRPMPTLLHQLIQQFMLQLLGKYVSRHAPGFLVSAGYKLRLPEGGFRQPDIIYIHKDHSAWVQESWCTGADLVVEIVSPDRKGSKRDYQEKLSDYARATVTEYWVIDPGRKRITVFTLRGKEYAQHGIFRPSKQVTSELLDGFSVAVDKLLDPPRILCQE